MSELLVVSIFAFWMLWTYFAYQCGYDNAMKDAETIAGRKLWMRKIKESARRRYTNIDPWEPK